MSIHVKETSLSGSMSDLEKQEVGSTELDAENRETEAHIIPAPVDVEKGSEETKSKSGAHGVGRDLTPNHPMHPSQFSGDRFERTPLLTLLGCFCVMVRSPEPRFKLVAQF